jgi:hypothetical protein
MQSNHLNMTHKYDTYNEWTYKNNNENLKEEEEKRTGTARVREARKALSSNQNRSGGAKKNLSHSPNK